MILLYYLATKIAEARFKKKGYWYVINTPFEKWLLLLVPYIKYTMIAEILILLFGEVELIIEVWVLEQERKII